VTASLPATRFRVLHRPARSIPDDGAHTTINVPSPAREQDSSNRNSWVQALLPIIGAFGFIGFVVISPSPLWIAIGVLFAVGMIASSIGMSVDQRKRQARQLMRDRRRYFAALADVRAQVRAAFDKQWSTSARCDPSPDLLLSVTRAPDRLWERRPFHPDFLQLRVGLGEAPLRATIKAPPESPSTTQSDPICDFELRRLLGSVERIQGAPIRLDLARSRWTLFTGDPRATRSAVRSVLAQAVTWHGPDDVRLLVATTGARVADWSWARWLPHLRWCESDLPQGSLLITDPDVLHASLLHLAASRRAVIEAAGSRRTMNGEEPRFPGPHLLVVLDGIAVNEESESLSVLRTTPGLAITVVQVADDAVGWDPPWADQIVLIDADRQIVRAPDLAVSRLGARSDDADPVMCESLARRLAAWRIPGHSITDAVRSPDVAELLGVGDVGLIDRDQMWARPGAQGDLAIPIGSAPDGTPVVLDLKESARGGMGPHGLLVGATGSGKSELLRTLVVGLALSHSPELVSLVLVDFKGGATFAGLADLPHVSGMITNLEDQLHLVDRMREALEGELGRRQQLLSDSGNLDSALEYRRVRAQSRPDLVPMPDLVVIVDEFSELIVARPDFVDTFVAIGRLGRSLGIHLLLASQRIDDGKLRGLDSHISYRIALRTFSPSDSSSAIGNQDAYYLPPVAGSGILKVGSTVYQRFRGAHVSAPYSSTTGGAPRQVTPFDAVATPLSLVDHGATTETGAGEHPSPVTTTIASVVVDRMHDDRRRTHRIWLPPLEPQVTLGSVLGALVDDADRGAVAVDWPFVGGLRAPFAMVDRPRAQQVAPYAPELSGGAGSMLVVGAPTTGKSTLLKALIVSLSLTHTPTEVQVYCVDLGGGSLHELATLPHVGSVAGRGNVESISRTIGQVNGMLTSREQLFAARQVASMAQYRQRRRDGELADQILGDVFLVIDGYGELRKNYEALDEIVVDVAARGAGFGIHVIVTANRSSDVRAALRDSLAGRVELRIAEPSDSVIDRRRAMSVPAGTPGRGLAADGSTIQVLLPVLDDHQPLVRTLSRIRHAWTGPVAPQVRVLPTEVRLSQLPAPCSDEPSGVPIGIEERDLAPFYLDLDEDPHFAVLGDSESGKTTVLAGFLRGLTSRSKPDATAVYVIDYRLTLVDAVAPEYLAGYASASTSVGQMVAELVALLELRCPAAGLSRTAIRERSWWSGPEIYLVVDDYDLVVAGFDNPLAPLSAFLPQGHDVGFHLLVARKTGGASRALADGVLGRMKEFGNPGLLLSGDRGEGTLLGGQRPALRPPGRGVYVARRSEPLIVQIAVDDTDARGANPGKD
jgi:S-DNA-T family DNA segregation ATPase FtsK/SpoIIIE